MRRLYWVLILVLLLAVVGFLSYVAYSSWFSGGPSLPWNLAPQRFNVSIPATEFVPKSNDYTVDYNAAGGLMNLETIGIDLYAPLQLPQAANITDATFFFYDNGPSYFMFFVLRTRPGQHEYIGQCENSPGSNTPGYSKISFTSVDQSKATVNNNDYFYTVGLTIPASQEYAFQYALVEYEVPP